jgi:hypothetical protein
MASGMPEPVSVMSRTAKTAGPRVSESSAMVISPPSGIACMELMSRLRSTCWSWPLWPSTITGRAGGSNGHLDLALGELEPDEDQRVLDDLGQGGASAGWSAPWRS